MEVDTRYQKFPEKPENPGFCWGKTELQFEKNMFIIFHRIWWKGYGTRMRKADTCLSAWTMVLEKKENWKIKDAIWEFVIYLHTVKKTSHNTEISYERDLRKMERYLAEHQVTDLNAVTETFLNSYMLYLERERLSPATVSRNVAAIRTASVSMWCASITLRKIRRKISVLRRWNGKRRRSFLWTRWTS